MKKVLNIFSNIPYFIFYNGYGNKDIYTNSHIYRINPQFWLFSRLLHNIYYERIQLYKRKFDILIAGSVKGRDYYLVNNIVKEYPLIKIAIILSNYEKDIDIIKRIINYNDKMQNNIYFYRNGNSYYDFYKILDNSKIYLNCGSKDEITYGCTGLLPVLGGKNIILSIDNSLYKYHINDGVDGFLYSTYDECIQKIQYILNLNDEQLNIIANKRYTIFNNNEQIEDICDYIFFNTKSDLCEIVKISN